MDECKPLVHGLDPALRVAFNTGTVMGMLVVSFGILGLTLCFKMLQWTFGSESEALMHLVGWCRLIGKRTYVESVDGLND